MAARGLQFLLQEWWVPVMPGHRRVSAGSGRQHVRRRHRGRHGPGRMSRLRNLPGASGSAAMVVILLVSDGGHLRAAEDSATPIPVHAYLGANASKAAIAKESAILGYNKPVIDQYFHYVGGLFHGNLGRSLRTRRSVATDIHTYLPGHPRTDAGRAGAGARARGFALGVACGRSVARHRILRVLMLERGLDAGLPAGPSGGAGPERRSALAAGQRRLGGPERADRAHRACSSSTPCCTGTGPPCGTGSCT